MRCRIQAIGFLLLAGMSQSWAGTIVGSKHDLSAVDGTNEICVFCHTPHSANIDLDKDATEDQLDADRPPAPLWNRQISREDVFTPYTSDTLNSACDATPSPLSLACLSCHDTAIGESAGELGYGSGAVSVDDQHNLFNEPFSGPSLPNCSACHPDGGFYPATEWQIGPNLSNDHPISMTYPTAVQDPDFNDPPNGGVKLFNNRVECPSCHDPHDPTNVPFLRETVDQSTICIACHTK
jgi:predicted CXXCH cytochrome family protein